MKKPAGSRDRSGLFCVDHVPGCAVKIPAIKALIHAMAGTTAMARIVESCERAAHVAIAMVKTKKTAAAGKA
ncbi:MULTISPECIES: hypothetical protein [unclassified Caballeronia]|uniref:hypothetical protein n=1 Tax=unclassified Caballeronia TaxID=2646786 RepID=UPI0028566C75|nr:MULTISPECIES: hypothetical protein [unclassified Caballeronia]MDR5737429.1 hypothetical protein [Caballeronia sp. LZ016]MDR5810042.1 hypothetical protein [Caballeronia sp. LZ019]